MRIKSWKPIYQRLLVSAISIPLLLFIIWTSNHPLLGFLFPLFTVLLISLALKEYYTIAQVKKLYPRAKWGIGLSCIYLLTIFLTKDNPLWACLPPFLLLFVLLSTFLAFFWRGKDPFVSLAVTLFGIVYLTLPLGCLLYFQTPEGRWWLIYLLAVTYVTDASALFVGKAFGTKPLAPYISPKKTWEGAIGGFLGAIAVSLLFVPTLLTLNEALLLGCAMSVLAQFGDLAESLLKRDVGVKDSSSIPGLGGMLDVVDSLIFTTPFLYFYLRSFYDYYH